MDSGRIEGVSVLVMDSFGDFAMFISYESDLGIDDFPKEVVR